MRQGGQVVGFLVPDNACVRQVEVRIIFVKPQYFDFAVLVVHGETHKAFFLFRAFGYTQQKPGFVVKLKYAWIEQTLDDHSRTAWLDILRGEQRILLKSL